MKLFAMTYPQLMNQAIDLGLSVEDLQLLRKAHSFAQKTSDSLYRAQDVPLLCHLIRSASIILSEKKPIHVVVAALLHAVYLTSYMRVNVLHRSRQSYRAQIESEFGEDVERLIWNYTQFPWYRSDAIEQHIEKIDQYSSDKRELILLRLANELEDYLDKAMAYTGSGRIESRIKKYGAQCIVLARKLGEVNMAENLSEISASYEGVCLPVEVVLDKRSGYELSRGWWEYSMLERWLVKSVRSVRRLLKVGA